MYITLLLIHFRFVVHTFKGALKNGFSVVPSHEQIYESCMQDYCLSKEGGAADDVTNEAVCQVISSYVKDLSEAGVNFAAWRSGYYSFCSK